METGMSLKILEEKTVSSQERELIKAYWEIKKGQLVYVYSYDELNVKFKEFASSRLAINNLVSSKSIVELHCELCGDFIDAQPNRKKLNLRFYEDKRQIICDSCLEEARSNRGNSKILSALKKAVSEKNVEQISLEEIEALSIIIQNKSRGKILGTLMQKEKDESEKDELTNEDQLRWEWLKKLSDMNLVWIDQGREEHKEKYRVHPELEDYMRERFPNFFQQTANINESSFKFKLETNNKKTSDKQPAFSGSISLNEDVVFDKHTEYQYGGWVNEDGSISIEIKKSWRNLKPLDETNVSPPSLEE